MPVLVALFTPGMRDLTPASCLVYRMCAQLAGAKHTPLHVRQTQLCVLCVQDTMFLECCKASDLWTECQGSDHCPVWADFDVPATTLPQDFHPPALSTSCMFKGMLLGCSVLCCASSQPRARTWNLQLSASLTCLIYVDMSSFAVLCWARLG